MSKTCRICGSDDKNCYYESEHKGAVDGRDCARINELKETLDRAVIAAYNDGVKTAIKHIEDTRLITVTDLEEKGLKRNE